MDQFSFTPLFDDQPMIMDDPSDVQFDDWLEPRWAPNHKVHPKQRPGDVSSALHEVAPLHLNSANTNQFIDNGLTTTDQVCQQFGYGTLPLSTLDKNEEVLPNPSQCSGMETFFGISPENNASLPSNSSDSNHNEHENLHLLSDVEYLASLPHSVLKKLSKNIAEATKQAKKKSIKSTGEGSLPVHKKKPVQNTASTSNTINDVLRCDHLGCTTTFRHRKDYLRHCRNKHESNAKKFSCPVVDCPSGFGHKFPRADKLRDHLRGDKILNLAHSCVLPGCSEILGDRAGLIDHLGQHNYETRFHNRGRITEHGFAPRSMWHYLWARYICNIPNCPFGTDEKDVMDAHLAIPHDGPYCPCPIPTCMRAFQDYDSTSTHLACEHDYQTRVHFNKEITSQCFGYMNCIFSCPVCHNEIKGTGGWSIFEHCKKHDRQALFQASKALVEALTFSGGPITNYGDKRFTITGDMIVPYIILSDKEKRKLRTKADFEQEAAKMKAETELERNTQLS